MVDGRGLQAPPGQQPGGLVGFRTWNGVGEMGALLLMAGVGEVEGIDLPSSAQCHVGPFPVVVVPLDARACPSVLEPEVAGDSASK